MTHQLQPVSSPHLHEPVPDYTRAAVHGTASPRLGSPYTKRHRTRDRPSKTSSTASDDFPDFIPSPDYSDREESPTSSPVMTEERLFQTAQTTSPKIFTSQEENRTTHSIHLMDDALAEMGLSVSPQTHEHLQYEAEACSDELIGPRHIPNPVQESADRRLLHREMMDKHKRGELFTERTELQRKLEDRRVKVEMRREQAAQQAQRTSLDRKLEQQALRLQQYEQQMEPHFEESTSELQKAFQKLKTHKETE